VIEQAVGFPDHAPGAVLNDSDIRRLVDEFDLISDFEEGSLQGASYDLRLGTECFTRGETRMLSADKPSCPLQPGQFILVTSHEELNLPVDVVGHAGLISRWAQRGLISLFSPQIDPGFVGLVVVPIFNAGHAPVTLKYRETIFTVEFVRMTARAARGWVETHAPLRSIPAAGELKMASPDLSEITARLAPLERSVGELRASLDGYLAGVGQKQGASGAKAGWIGAGVGLGGLIAAVAAVLIDQL
jgi:deoxycytidine triphosphate deaminase